MTPDRERELVQKAAKDPEAFTEIYMRAYPRILGFIAKRVGNLDIAKDIASETFIKALNNIKNFKWQNISVISWLYKIASNEIINHFRKNKDCSPVCIEDLPEPAASTTPIEEFALKENEKSSCLSCLCLHKNLRQIPDIYREVLALKYFRKKKIAEIADITGKKEGTIKSLIHRGLKKLGEMYLEEEESNLQPF